MTKLQQLLYDYILDEGMQEYLDQARYAEARQRLAESSAALEAVIPKSVWNRLNAYQTARGEVDCLEAEAIFAAALSIARGLF